MTPTSGRRRIEWVVLDLGETLVDETRGWASWAQWLGVPTFTFFAEFGAVLAERRPHTDAIEAFRPGADLREQVRLKDEAGLGWSPTVDDSTPTPSPPSQPCKMRVAPSPCSPTSHSPRRA